jgi:septation ring formation regulator EzrA
MLFIKKPYLDLEKKFKDIMSLHKKDLVDHFVRLEKISKSNLVYYQYYENLKIHFQAIEQDVYPKAQQAMDQLLKLVKEHQNKSFNLYYPATRTTLDIYQQSVEDLLNELQKIMQPEDETQSRIEQVKESIRLLRTEYFNRRDSLGLVESQFTNLLKNLDDMMINVDQKMDAGEYDDILVSINKMSKVTTMVLGLLDQLPRLCTLIQTVIPDKLTKLVDDVETLVKLGYPLHHLLIKDTINKAKDELEFCRNKLNNFDVKDMEKQLRSIADRLDQFYPLFEKEKNAKITFDQEYEHIYARVNQIEKNFSKLNAQMPKLKEYYVFEDTKLKDIETIKVLISQLNMTKRGLDTLVLSGTKQPYSLQVDKITTLKTDSDKADALLQAFQVYTTGLKQKVIDAHQSVNQYYLKFKETEKLLLDLNIPSLIEMHQEKFTEYYQRLKIVVDAFQIFPIDMNVIQENLTFIQTDGDSMMKDIQKTITLAKDAERLLIQANKDRHRTSDHQRIIQLAEQAFFEGKFEKAYQETSNLLKKITTIKPIK